MIQQFPRVVPPSASSWADSPTIALKGELDLSTRKAVTAVLRPAEHMKRVTLDLRAVTYFDASTLGCIIRLRIAMGLGDDNRRIRLLANPNQVRLLRIVQFDTLFEVEEFVEPAARRSPAQLQLSQASYVCA